MSSHGKTALKVIFGTLLVLAAGIGLLAFLGGAPPQHPVDVSTLGVSSSSSAMEKVLDTPGTVELQTVVGADWSASRGGLLNLDAPAATEAKLVEGPEPIEIFLHALTHPSRGLFLVDTGVERLLATHPEESAVGSTMIKMVAPVQVRQSTGDWLGERRPAGVLFTHLHIDHIMGVPDLPADTPLYAGPELTGGRSAQNLLVAPIIDRELAGKGPLHQWAFKPDLDGRFAGIYDVFADGMVWAIWVPGHTAGSVAYAVRTPQGAVLLTGDASHTRWGWDHHVAPGAFSANKAQAAESFKKLQDLAARHPAMRAVLGHQA